MTRKESIMIKLPPYQKSVIIGLLLSDGWLIFASKTNKNARLGLKQSLARSTYVFHVFNLLSHYCSSLPNLTSSVRVGKINYAVGFFTRSLPCFTNLHSLFYPLGIKIIPSNIYELLTPIALAHLIMGDGSPYKKTGITICTDSYTIQDVVLLINVLIIRYNINCTIHEKKEGQYRIYISKNSFETLKGIIKPYIIPSMLYKINL